MTGINLVTYQLEWVDSIEFQQHSHIISLIRSEQKGLTSSLSIRDYLLLKQELSGRIVKQAILIDCGMIAKPMTNIMSMPLSVQALQGTGYIMLMGIQYIQDNQYDLFAASFDNYNVFDVNNQGINSQAAPFNAIIRQMYYNFGYLVGCIESLENDSALMGMFIFHINSPQSNVLLRSATQTYFERNFECIGVKIAAVDLISLVYTAQSAEINRIFIVTLKVDPFTHPVTTLSEQVLVQMKYEATKVYQFKYVDTKNDYFHLGQVTLWKNQQNKTSSQINVSQLQPLQERRPKQLTQYIDCFLGELCEIYFSKFSFANQCSDEVTINKMYSLGITMNQGNLNYYNVSEYSTMIANFSLRLNQTSLVGHYSIQITYNISETPDLIKNWVIFKENFTLNVSNACQLEYKVLENIQNVSIRHKISTDIIYQSIPRLILAPHQSCFKQTPSIIRYLNEQDVSQIIITDKLSDFQVGFLVDSPEKIGVYEFLFSVKVEADIEYFEPKTYQTYSFKFILKLLLDR
ncbi:UNKNOWN [Stylonychia lemnae]|uniref:Uncharacterized protein n=1 Tax=Stylonychia lemnae TaxID=5949 RepID=A0A078AE95_STYLE|nr:UNKNOWN [Stylonychia lemnae]|eukprot:CDW79243.1 UNKNOWN [Stylonychia lemnae]